MNDFPISRSKVTAPPVRQDTLVRERLLEWLESAVLRRVVFVVAEAGYGKTTLLADFTRRTRVRCLWYKLDEPDRDWLTFLHYLVATGREAIPDFAPTTATLLAQARAGEPMREAAIESLAGELEQLDDRPTAFIFDDYHLVDGAAEIGRIVQRLIRGAPERTSFVFLSRRRPSLGVARLHAQDEVRELGREELRFSRDETGRLFSETYRQPLEADVLDEVDSRTEGWAASLQLLRSGLRGRNEAEVRAFVRRMSGAEGRLYDYLAEEVIGDLPDPLRRFLVRTSVLDRVTPELARAALAAGEAEAPTLHEMRALIQGSETMGLLSRRGETSRWSHRYHPLIRDYLRGKLDEELGSDEVRELHRAIARAAEPIAWSVAAHHWLEAGEAKETVDLIERQIAAVAASGQYSLAADYLTRASVDTPGEIAAIVRARIDLWAGRIDRAREYLASALRGRGRHNTEALQLLMSIATALGDVDTGAGLAKKLLERDDLEAWQVPIARAILAMREASISGAIQHQVDAVEDAAIVHERQRRWHLAAVSRYNLAEAHFAAGAYARAASDVRKSIEHMERSSGDVSEAGAAHALLAASLANLGLLEEAERGFAEASRQSRTPLYGFEIAVRHAEHLADTGCLSEALNAAVRAVSEVEPSATWNDASMIASFCADIATKTYALETAHKWLASFDALRPTSQTAGLAHQLLSRARLSVLQGFPEARAHAGEALAHASRQGAWHFAWRAQLVRAVATGHRETLAEAIAEVGRAAPAALRSEAVVLTAAAHILDPLPAALDRSIEAFPAAWRPHFRHRLDDPDPRVRLANARLLDRFGEWEDVPRLRLLARTGSLPRGARALGKDLALRTAPRVFVDDLGRTTLRVDERTIEATAMRRKVAALVVFLLTRPGFAAAREQVLEALWPDAPPDVGANSLHQTIYFLRREIEPNYREDSSPGYLRLAGELVWLDPELVDSASRRFAELASASHAGVVADSEAAIRLYRGRFAPEFEYEEWAISTRDVLHAAYLELVERTLRAHAANGDWIRGTEIGRLALAVDPSAEGVERNLIALYHHAGSHAAASEQYAHFAATQRSEYGVEPPSLESVVISSKST